MQRAVLLVISVATQSARALATQTPIWLTRPVCSSEAALKAAVPLQMLPPRRLEATDVDERGRSTEGKCLPYALLLQLQRVRPSSSDLPTGADLRSIDTFRDRVLDFAVANQEAAWRADEYAKLGDVVSAVVSNRGWAPARPNALAVPLWAARLRTTPKEGCDAAFLFAAAACYGVRVHVHYKTRAGLMADTQFAAPPSADPAWRPRDDVHIGYCDNEMGGNHYVSLPAVWQR